MQVSPVAPTRSDIILNYLAVFVAGISGLLLILLIGGHYGSIALGLFNQVFAIHMVLAQLAAFGIHLSVLKQLTEARGDASQIRLTFAGALTALLPTAVGTSLLLALAAPAIGALMHNPDMEQGLYLSACGLFFFLPE